MTYEVGIFPKVAKGPTDVKRVMLNRKRADKVGEGAFRQVYRYKDKVVKIQCYGEQHNKGEVLRYEKTPSDLLRHLAKVHEIGVANGRSFVIQDFIGGKMPTYDQYKERVREIEELGRALGISDSHRGNFRIVNGIIVFIDFAR